jgi:hypothetical protein
VQPPNPERPPMPRPDADDAASPTRQTVEIGSSNTTAAAAEPTPQRRRRRGCPKRTPLNRPRRISKKAKNGGRCDYLDPDGKICSQWQAPDSDACWCHFDAYNARTGVEMPYPRSSKTRSGGWKKPPTVFVKMIPNELGKAPRGRRTDQAPAHDPG